MFPFFSLSLNISEYSTTSLTAESDDDFVPEKDSIVEFSNGKESETIKITIKCDDKKEGPEVFAVSLYHPPDADPTVCTGKIGQPGTAYITVHDPQTSALSF